VSPPASDSRRVSSFRDEEGLDFEPPRLRAYAPRLGRRRRILPVAVTDDGYVSTALAPRRRHEPEQARGRVSHAASSAHRWRRLPVAELAPRPSSALPADSARVASDPHRASEATRCHAALCPRPPLARLPPSRHRSVAPDGPRAAVCAPRGTCRFATPAVTRRDSRRMTLLPTARVAGVATSNDPTPPLDGDHVRRSM
jgi:hypothetical protein